MKANRTAGQNPWPWIWGTFGVLGALTLYTMATLDTKGVDLGAAAWKTLGDLGTLFLNPRLDKVGWGETGVQVLRTLGLAFLTTLIGALLSFPLALTASRNLGHRFWGRVILQGVAVVRAVPTVLWVLIFAIAAGLGAAAAVIGMTFHTLGYLIKAYSESFEELDDGVLEALRAGGAKYSHIVFQAAVPASLTYLVSWTFIRFEINFVVAVAMGAAAGAGGIGFDLYMASSMYFDLKEVGALTYMILAVAWILEYLAAKMKSKIRGRV